MVVRSIRLKQFRNYDNAVFRFSDSINVICGDNGTGKTNIVEALSVLSNIKSFRKAGDTILTKYGTDGYYLQCQVDDDGEERLFEIGYSAISKTRRRCKIDGTEIETFSRYYGQLLLVIAAPDDLFLVDGDPDSKRKYTDSVISKYDASYLQYLSEYRRVLKNRNHILKHVHDGRVSDDLSAWDELFAEKASHLTRMRSAFFASFTDIAEYYYSVLSGEAHQLYIRYENCLGVTERDDILHKVGKNRQRDIIFKTSTCGPHRDSYDIRLDERPFRETASQGQKRLMALSFKLAERDITETASGKRCILCLDDIFSELDKKRRHNLLQLLGSRNQILLTVVDTDLLDSDFTASGTVHQLE